MSKTKRHPCGNCIAFGDEVCMQNYLECDYAEIEEEKEVENKFKVGDKVRFVGDYELYKGAIKYGNCFWVHAIESESRIDVTNGIDVYSGVSVNSFELIEEKKEFHSSHYESDSIEPISYIMGNKMSFNRGNIIKYASRVGKKKGQEKLDCHKIIDYTMLLAIEEGIELDKDEIIKLINYRFDWSDNNVCKK